jgi:hypothetical protein
LKKIALALAAMTLLSVSAAAGVAKADAPRIVPWTKIGDVGIGMLEARVAYEYGQPTGPDGGNGMAMYHVPGGMLNVQFEHGRVSEVDTSSPRYVTPTGIRVGTKIPIGHLENGAYHWNGFTLSTKVGVPGMWVRYWHTGGKRFMARLDTGASIVPGMLPSQPPGVINSIEITTY